MEKRVVITDRNTYQGELSCIKAKTKNMIKDSHIIEIINRVRPVRKYLVELVTGEEFKEYLENSDEIRREVLKSKTVNKPLLTEEEVSMFGCNVIHQRHVKVFTAKQVDNNLIQHKLLIHIPELDVELKTGKISKVDAKSHFRI